MRSKALLHLGLIVFLSGVFSLQARAQDRVVLIQGHVCDSKTKSPIVGVNIVILNTTRGTMTDGRGSFSLNLKPGTYEISFSYVGYEPRTVRVRTSEVRIHPINIFLVPTAYTANEVIVRANKFTTSPSVYDIKGKDLKYIPVLNSDILRGMTILPGVSSNDELSSAYNVHGQNFNDNLIYLDGFEIYLPYLAQQGMQENMSVINENMVRNFTFYNAAFPVQFGDKMSSVLAVSYKDNEDTLLGGEVNADLLNMGLTLHDRIGKLSWIAGVRYAYPSSFTGVLQTKGSYLPRYTDFQLHSTYILPNRMKLQMLFITARNSFDLSPQDWTGNFQYGYWSNFQQIYLNFTGANNYQYDSNLLGLTLTSPLSSHSSISISAAFYSDRELYNENLHSNAYYLPSPKDFPDMSYLETGYQFADNALTMNRFEFKTAYNSNYGTYGTKVGITLRSSSMNNSLDEFSAYTSLSRPSQSLSKQNFVFNSISAYLGEEVEIEPDLTANIGARALKDYFNGQFLVSPRASASFQLNPVSSINFGWGYYFQPPSFYETRNKTLQEAKSLLSQQAIHYALRYENNSIRSANLMAEVFYQNLSKLIPYSYTNELELTYGNSNDYAGYAYGLDLQYEGKLTQSLETWIGYDYLNSEDRNVKTGSPYQPSLLDQTNTIRIFLQDAMPGIHNSQAHVRLLFGTGYLYHPMVYASGTSSTNSPQMVPDYSAVEQYPWYYRVDMGLTFRFAFEGMANVILTADVFNVFDNRNVLDYAWYIIPQVSPQPVPVPNILSERYFDVGVKVDF